MIAEGRVVKHSELYLPNLLWEQLAIYQKSLTEAYTGNNFSQIYIVITGVLND